MSRYKLNVLGDFYVEDGQCISCTMPILESPNLIGEDNSSDTGYHCYFKKQPESPSEIQSAIDAMDVSCCEAHRYCGSDSKIIQMLKARGLKSQIDDV
jgi:hypothetical protein